MHLRKDRLNQIGKSNIDYKYSILHIDSSLTLKIRAQTTHYEDLSKTRSQTRIDILSQSKNKNFSQIIKEKINRTAVDPKAETESFYKLNGKNIKKHVEIGYPREAQLEEKERRKIAFTGESEMIYMANYDFLEMGKRSYSVPQAKG